MTSSWLEDVVVLNENNDPECPGDVGLYRNAGELCRHLEHWYVTDVKHLVLNGAGDRILLATSDKTVVVDRCERFSEGPGLLKAWLRSRAERLLADRAARKKQPLGEAETRGILPDTIEGLIAYVGFDK